MKSNDALKELVHSNLRDIENFEKSTIWADVCRILDDWSEGLKEDYDKASNMEDVRRIQGISECIKYVQNIPDAMKTIISEEEKKDA